MSVKTDILGGGGIGSKICGGTGGGGGGGSHPHQSAGMQQAGACNSYKLKYKSPSCNF